MSFSPGFMTAEEGTARARTRAKAQRHLAAVFMTSSLAVRERHCKAEKPVRSLHDQADRGPGAEVPRGRLDADGVGPGRGPVLLRTGTAPGAAAGQADDENDEGRGSQPTADRTEAGRSSG